MAYKTSRFRESNTKILERLKADPSVSSGTVTLNSADPIFCQILHTELDNDTITPSACKKIMEYTEKFEKLKNVCDLSKIKVRPDDGRAYLIIKRKPISSISYTGLIDKLYEHFFGFQTVTMEDFFEIWMKWRAEATGVTPKTIKENRFLWNSLLKDVPLTKGPLKDLTVQDYIAYFRSITKDRKLTRKRFNDLKSIINGLLYLAVEQGVLSTNCLNDINYKQFTYKAENCDIAPFTESERMEIINHLDNEDFYSLAIKFDFYMILRIGELKGLKWSDIKNGFIHVQRFVDDKNNVIDDIKGHQKEGRRFIPLIPAAETILKRIHDMNPNSEYIFFQNQKPLTTSTFNRHLKRCCEELGIEYRSSHKIRFSTASIMYKNGVSATELSNMLGHTTLQMTNHYLRNITPAEETAEKMRMILS